jgi:hypothetical protein
MIKSRRVGWARHVECIRAMRNAYSVIDGKPEGKESLERSAHARMGNIIMQEYHFLEYDAV